MSVYVSSFSLMVAQFKKGSIKISNFQLPENMKITQVFGNSCVPQSSVHTWVDVKLLKQNSEFFFDYWRNTQ